MSTISANGATEVLYFQQSGSSIQYKRNQDAGYVGVSSWPLTINNTNASAKLKILLENDLLFTSTSHYFIFDGAANVGPIQLGDTKLLADGQRRTIFIQNVSQYQGLIRNGTSSAAGKGNITVCNLMVNGSTSDLLIGSGWFGWSRYGRDATANFFINCESSGDIATGCGGILGDFAGYKVSASSSSLTLIRCVSNGNMGANCGGIVSTWAGQGSGASLLITQCSSIGTMEANSGGIVGTQAANSQGSVTVFKCSAIGNIIGSTAGGIFGSIAGVNGGSVLADTCYYTGDIIVQIGAGGIFGSVAGSSSSTAIAKNCYTTGSIDTANGCGGIFGQSLTDGIAQNCYVAGSTTASTGYIYSNDTTVPSGCYSEAKNSGSGWTTVNANTALTGDPITTDVGTSWVAMGTNIRYEINGVGYTPYQQENILNNSLITEFSQTISPGASTRKALIPDAPGNAFTIKLITGGVQSSYTKISMNRQTGMVSTNPDIALGTYTLTVGSTGSYFVTTFTLTIANPSSSTSSAATEECCVSGNALKGSSYEMINQFRIGNALVSEQSANSQMRFSDYAEYVRYKMSQGSAKR